MPDEAHEETERLLQDLEQRITAEYRQAAEELEEKCNDYFRRYRIKDQIKRQQLANGESQKHTVILITKVRKRLGEWLKKEELIGEQAKRRFNK